MKAKLLLIGSLAVNVGLAAAWFTSRPAVPVAEPVEQEVETASQAKLKVIRSKARSAGTNADGVSEKQLDWSTVESADYVAYIENLRSIGCPEETIRDIIIADINKLYAPKIAAVYPSPLDFKFWKTDSRNNREEERERDEKRRALEREKRELITELLGVDYEAEIAKWSGRPDEDAWRYGFLSPEKQTQIKTLAGKYRDMERALFNEGGGWNAENRTKFAAMRAQRESEMTQILSAEEFQEYQLRTSWTARSMRETLASFEPNEEEFRKIFEIRQGYDQQFGFTRDSGDEALREQRRVAQHERDEQMKALLGEQRFKEYQMAQDDDYRDIYGFAQRNNVPNTKQVAETLYEVRQAVDEQRRAIERDQNISSDQRRTALKSIYDQTQQALGPTVGEDVWQQLQRERWIARLTQTDSDRGRDSRGGSDRDRDRR